MAAVIGGLTPNKLGECIYVVADASRRPGSDIVAWYVAVAGGVPVVEALARVRELGANYDRLGESFAVAQMVPLDLLPELLSAIGPGNADRVHGWLSATLPCANVRTLLIAGSNVAFTLMPLKTTSS
jgi:hypothetical protein